MSSPQSRSERFRKIRLDIEKHGQSVTMVSPCPTPRYAYTIGLRDVAGFELAMAGGCYFTGREVHQALNDIGGAVRADPGVRVVEVPGVGSFELRFADETWARDLALGAFDFYDSAVSVAQIVPDADHITVDVPDATRVRSSSSESAWKWLSEPWDLPVPEDAVVTTNIAALRGAAITELTRWEDGEWEMFAGPGPDVSLEDVRVVPLGILLGADPSIRVAFDANVGEGFWRHDAASPWQEWKARSG